LLASRFFVGLSAFSRCCGPAFAICFMKRSKRGHAPGTNSISFFECGVFVMPRQPFLQATGNARAGNLDIGPTGLGKRPELEAIVAHCIIAWPTVEVEMAMILGHLIGAKDNATLAVFHHLRRSSAQREAILEAAKTVLNETDLELLSAFLNVHRSI
jgi:hypothetical protein